ncbi:MAG: iron-sulfur cluster assembly scaffold protein [Chloroflexi bacterium]|nr:MAG: iron-sulfur cluster assembly scaffold protein [Chloroflexota bacterium]
MPAMTYSEAAINHTMDSRSLSVVQDDNGFVRVAGPCSVAMEIWLKGNTDVIAGAIVRTDGCSTSVASGSMATEMAQGKSIGEALKITRRDVLDVLESAR